MAQYRVKIQSHFSSYNAGETAYCSSGTAQALVTAGIATAVDALPANVPITSLAKPAGWTARAFVTGRHVPVPAVAADSDTNAAEACLHIGF